MQITTGERIEQHYRRFAQMTDVLSVAKSYLRISKKFPSVWCPGCGLGIIETAIIEAIYNKKVPRDKVVLVAGIGCTGRMPTYLDFNTVHVTHGRAIPAATGIKMANPELHVFTIMGDGDAAAIGGNHLIHAARRNIDIDAIIVNNYIYGMTGGQYSPTTPLGAIASTAPYGQFEPPFDICHLMVGAGASFVARTTAFHPRTITSLVETAMDKKGFTVIEILSNCHTTFGRRNQQATAVESMRWLKENTLSKEQWISTPEEKRAGKIMTGIFQDIVKPEYIENYENMAEATRIEEQHRLKLVSKQPPPEIPPRKKSYPEPVKMRFSGSGGQGLVLAGVIYGRAAAIYDKRNATQTQSYGPEARGGASKSDIIISDSEIDHPVAEELDVLLCMNKESYNRYKKDLKQGGILIVDPLQIPSVTPEEGYSIRFTEIAQNIVGKIITANVVALGALSILVPCVSAEAILASLKDTVPAAFLDINIKAFEEGIKAAQELKRN
jgi:2-oxoglutarate/2-oxoacid ferredoxin oxidoreductase subunit beta